MASTLEAALSQLSEIQRKAVAWGAGPLLVLAGPGSGKTQVLTCRIARLLDESRDKNFRVLALTFTNKAADEMRTRVAEFVPGLEHRTMVATIHSFCAQVLRQHGSHLGIQPDFAIYSNIEDRRAVLQDGLRLAADNGANVGPEHTSFLALIDELKVRLVEPGGVGAALASRADASVVAAVYEAYEAELRRLNALDFNSLILETYRLCSTFPAVAARYRATHPYWLIDEFQDTNTAQYRTLRALAGKAFNDVFAVADDDQILYQWNGASFAQIQAYIHDFKADVIQLPTNYRCPPAIVDAANRLVAYNAQRTDAKAPLIAAKTDTRFPEAEHIQLRVFSSDEEEVRGIAGEIRERGASEWGRLAVLARTRALLDGMCSELKGLQVPAIVAQRRDEFLSAELRWLVAVLRQVVRPLDRRNVNTLVDAFNRVAGCSVDVAQVLAEAESSGQSYLGAWLDAAGAVIPNDGAGVLTAVTPLVREAASARQVIEVLLKLFDEKVLSAGEDSDIAEDLAAWRELSRDIGVQLGGRAPLDQFLQELQLRSKEPATKAGTVTLMTVHGAKGREYDVVYVIGLAEDIMPSFQSKKKGDRSAEMEEERRNCFVAITRAKECLILSRAVRYRGWEKKPSRFLLEMSLIS